MTNSAFLKQIFAEKQVPTPGGGSLPLKGSVSFEEGEFIQKIILDLRPKKTIEVGCSLGISGHFICEALTGVSGESHTIIDSGQRVGRLNVGYFNLLQCGYGSLLEFITDSSQNALPLLAIASKRFQFVLIDGAHTFDHTLVDLFYIDRMLDVGGVVVFDDADWPSIRKVVKFVASNRRYELFDFVGKGPDREDFYASKSSMAALRKLDHDRLGKTRDWSHFVNF